MKLLATDYDGTLKFGDTLADEDIEAIRKWKEQGNLFSIVTGRSSQSIFAEAQKYGLPVDYFITNNGGMVFDGTGEPLNTTQLDTMTAIDLIFVAKETGDVVSLMVNDGYSRHKIVIDPTLEDHRYPHVDPDLTEEQIMNLGQFGQIVFSMRDKQAAMDYADSLNQFFGHIITAYANNYCVDVVPHNISKASGLEFVTEYAGVPEMDVYCMGDSYNDLPMLERCFNSAASGLAPQEVKDNAASVYPTLSAFIDDIIEQ